MSPLAYRDFIREISNSVASWRMVAQKHPAHTFTCVCRTISHTVSSKWIPFGTPAARRFPPGGQPYELCKSCPDAMSLQTRSSSLKFGLAILQRLRTQLCSGVSFRQNQAHVPWRHDGSTGAAMRPFPATSAWGRLPPHGLLRAITTIAPPRAGILRTCAHYILYGRLAQLMQLAFLFEIGAIYL